MLIIMWILVVISFFLLLGKIKQYLLISLYQKRETDKERFIELGETLKQQFLLLKNRGITRLNIENLVKNGWSEKEARESLYALVWLMEPEEYIIIAVVRYGGLVYEFSDIKSEVLTAISKGQTLDWTHEGNYIELNKYTTSVICELI